LSEEVPESDIDTVEQIGVEPLWSLVHEWRDETLTAVEAEASTHPRLLQALAVVIPPDQVARERIQAILARHGVKYEAYE
jgi:hypothetical protein